VNNNELQSKITELSSLLMRCRNEIGKQIIGQKEMVDSLLMGIIAGGHILIEGVPGLAKTKAVKTMADVMSIDFRRIQFTPDLLPADLTGHLIYRRETGEFTARKGPVFTNIVLADEINRAPAKVQSALLEAMAEQQVTIGDNTYPLPSPFFVLATQNPIEQEGTYQLPEAQLDRFLMKLKINYPSPDEELEILRLEGTESVRRVEKVMGPLSIAELRATSEHIAVDERIQRYIVSLVTASREKDHKILPFARYLEYGASPRATIALYRCARVKALFEQRAFVLPEDIKAVAPEVLRHRLVLSYEAEAESLVTDDVIEAILSSVSVP
jgi:MoxR-like ATPase